MAFDGFGSFIRLRSWIADATAGVKIRADFHDDEDNNLAAGLTNCICKDGQSTITQNIPFNSKRVTALSDPVDPQDASTKAYADTKMALDGSTPITGDLIIRNDDPTITLDGKSGFDNGIFGDKGGKHRWKLVLGDNIAETGNNVGSNFDLYRYADDGTLLSGAALFGSRATGLMTVKGDPTTPLGISTKQYADSKLPLAGGTITGSLTVNGGLTSPGNNTLGATATAGLNNTGALNCSGTITCNSVVNATGGVMVYNGDFGFSDSGTFRVFRFTTVWRWEFNSATGTLAWGNASGYITTIRNDGALIHNFNAFKPGGGTWADSSDARIKNIAGAYTHGLAEIKQLQPQRYTFKGNDVHVTEDLAQENFVSGQVHSRSYHRAVAEDRKEFIGLIAQEAEGVMPEMVATVPAVIDGVPVDDLRVLDPNALTYALINAVKELAARVEALEVKPATGG